MKIDKLVKRELTAAEKLAAKQFAKYTNYKVPFLILGDYTVFIPKDITLRKDEQIEKAKRAMKEVISFHPDFNTIFMDDNFALVRMTATEEELYCVSNGEVELDNEDRISLSAALPMREYALAACRMGDVIAIVKTE